jgi:hypothetical protein
MNNVALCMQLNHWSDLIRNRRRCH